jgi:transglutaminase-like putative cysteine protease
MNRRDFLRRAAVGSAACALTGRNGRALTTRTRSDDGTSTAVHLGDDGWRTFELMTRVRVLKPSGVTRAWLPMPLVSAPYQKTLGDTYVVPAAQSVMVESEDLDMLVVEWNEGIDPVLTVTSRVATQDRAANLVTPTVPPLLDVSPLAVFLRPTRLIPTDGIVKDTADVTTKGAGTDFERARAIYDWIVDHTFRNPATRGCGTGDIRFMLESKNLGGTCADLNSLFVGLARAAGIPARDVFGIRVAPSRTGLRTLGLTSADATRAHHCRAEVHLTGYGWVPVDPADVRKVALDEPPGHLTLADEKVRDARARLFGSWEMNWVAFNMAHDVVMPRSKRGPLGYFMYPQAETANGRLDSLDPDTFSYEITTREL